MHPRSAALAVARVIALAVALIVLVFVSIGWCYWLRAPTSHWPGPRISEVLPLDELPSHSEVSLLAVGVVFALAGLAAGKIARLLRFDGLAIALSVGATVSGWLYLASAISIFVVRQVSLDEAFDATRDLQPVYIAGALFVLAVACTSRRCHTGQWLTRLLPGCIGLLGVISLLIATLPRSSIDSVALGGLLKGPVSPVTRTVEVTIGIVLLICARGLGRRSRRALILACVLVFVLLITRVVDGFNIVALVVDVVVLAGLITRRSDFSFKGDPTTQSGAIVRFGSLAICTFAYGVAALAINRTAAGLRIGLVPALRSTLHALLIGAPHQASLISGGFAEWFPWSLRSIVGIGIGWGVSSWFAPWRHHLDDEPDGRRRAADLVESWGTDTLAPFTLRDDKALYFFPEGQEVLGEATTLLAYRVIRGIAIVSGDPIGPADQLPEAISAFRAMCASRGWRFALLGASDRLLELYRSLGLHVIYHGDEAIIDTSTFSLNGGSLKSVRQAVRRVERKGFHAEICTAGELGPVVRAELSELEQRWLCGERRKGFVMELDELFRLDGDDAVLVVGRGPDDRPVGFLELAVCRASSSLSLSAMPRAADTPNGLNAYLIVAAVEWAREHHFDALSLNFSPVARLLDRRVPCRGWRRIARRVLLIVKRVLGLQLDNLLVFNRHFAPRWQPRYVIVERFRHLPRVVVAAMAAERYLPFSDLLRGRDWQIPSPRRDPAPATASP